MLELANDWLDVFNSNTFSLDGKSLVANNLVDSWDEFSRKMSAQVEKQTSSLYKHVRSQATDQEIQDLANKWLLNSSLPIATRILALRVLAELVGYSEQTYRIIEQLLESELDSDLRAWAAYSFTWIVPQNTSKITEIVSKLNHLLSAENSTIIRERAARALRVICILARPNALNGSSWAQETVDHSMVREGLQGAFRENSFKQFNLITDALWNNWKNEYDWTVNEHIVIAWGRSAGFQLTDNFKDMQANNLTGFLSSAISHPFKFVVDRLPDALQNIILTILKANHWTKAQDDLRRAALGEIEEILKNALITKMNAPLVNVPETKGLVSESWETEYKRDLILCIRDIAILAFDQYSRPENGQLSTFYLGCAQDAVGKLMDIANQRFASELPTESRRRAVQALNEFARTVPQSQKHIVYVWTSTRLKKLVETETEGSIALEATDALTTVCSTKAEAANNYCEYILNAGSLSQSSMQNELICKRWAIAISRVSNIEQVIPNQGTIFPSESNDQAINTLVEAMKTKPPNEKSQAAERALRVISSEKVIRELRGYIENFIQDKFYKPIETFQTEAIDVLKDVRRRGSRLFWVIMIASIVVVTLGIALAGYSLLVFNTNSFGKVDPSKWVGVIVGLIAAIAGMLTPFIWNSMSTMSKSYSDVSKSAAGLLGFILRTRLLGLGFAHAYSEGKFDKKSFFIDAANSAGEATKDIPLIFADIGKLDIAQPLPAQYVEIPKGLKGKQALDVAQTLTDLGLKISPEERPVDDDAKVGTLIDWESSDGYLVKPGSTIILKVGKKQGE